MPKHSDRGAISADTFVDQIPESNNSIHSVLHLPFFSEEVSLYFRLFCCLPSYALGAAWAFCRRASETGLGISINGCAPNAEKPHGMA